MFIFFCWRMHISSGADETSCPACADQRDCDGMDDALPLQRDICGVGLVLSNARGNGNVTIGAICPGSPSACSGIIALGDEIVSVDGRSVTGLRAFEIADLLKGDRHTLIRICLRKANGFASQYQIWLVRDRLSEKDVAIMSENNILGSPGIGIKIVNDVTSKIKAWSVTEIQEAGGAWLARSCVKAGAAFQPILQIGDYIEAINFVPVPIMSDAVNVLMDQAFTRITIDVERNGRKMMLDLVRTPTMNLETLQCTLDRLNLIREHTLKLERSLSEFGLKCMSWNSDVALVEQTPPQSFPGNNELCPKDGQQRGNYFEKMNQGSAHCSSKMAINLEEERLDSPRSTLSTDSLDDIVLSLSQSVASRHGDPTSNTAE